MNSHTVVLGHVLLLLGCLLPVKPAIGQAPYKHLQGCSDTTYAAVVVGRIIGTTAEELSSRHHALLEGADYCFVVPDSLGRFEFRNVRPGDYRLLITGAFPGFHPFEFSVVGGDTTTLTAAVEAYDVFGPCNVFQPCREVLDPRPERVLTPDVDPLIEAGFRTAVAVAWTMGDVAWAWVPCFRNARPALMVQLRLRVPTAVTAQDCDIDWTSAAGPDARVVHRASGRRAFVLEFRLLDRTESRGEGYVRLSVAPLWGAEWQCYYQRGAVGWELTNCDLKALS